MRCDEWMSDESLESSMAGAHQPGQCSHVSEYPGAGETEDQHTLAAAGESVTGASNIDVGGKFED